ncbi:LysR substrate-binding domain-containing protein [Clostridium sp. DL1XJH146]
MDHRDWLILKHLSNNKNITKTADLLFISQPAITNRLKQLEEELDIKIALRGRRGINFTPEGEMLINYANRMLNEYDGLQENLKNIKNDYIGTLKIAVSRYISKYILPKLLKSFKEKYPKVEFQIITDWSSNVYKSIYNNDAHIGFVRGDYQWHGEKISLFEDYLCIASTEPFEISNLPNLQRIDYRTDTTFKNAIDNWWHQNFTTPSNISIKVDQADTCKEMILNGLGYGIITYHLIKDNKDLYSMPIRNKKGELIKRNTWMFYTPDTSNLNIVRAFIEFVKEYKF